MAGHVHRHPLWHTEIEQVAEGCPAKVVVNPATATSTPRSGRIRRLKELGRADELLLYGRLTRSKGHGDVGVR